VTTSAPDHHYRPDIDGLRSLAILPVILFHAGFFCSGGFVGVDVFFVISGYLITKILLRELAERRFSIVRFYERRIRRIFPALFSVFALTGSAAFLVLPPDEFQDFGKTLVASSAFASNILFYGRAGYFGPGADAVPLLHTWSLSVEEQFYILWPLLLIALNRQREIVKVTATLVLVLGSLVLSAYWVKWNANAAFYLLPSRAWQLGLGAVVAFPVITRLCASIPAAIASAASLAGIAAILGAVFLFDDKTPFPGVAALVPCLGAALVLAASEGGKALGGRMLSWKPLVWVGQASFSLYLWHWPILVFGQLVLNHRLSSVERGALVLATFVLSWISLRFIERPFRSSRARIFKSSTWVLAGLAVTSAFLMLGVVIVLQQGMPGRGPDVRGWAKSTRQDASAFQASRCLARGETLPNGDVCLLGAPSNNGHYQAVLYGDSHGAQYAPAIADIGRELGITFRQLTKAGCPPTPSVHFFPEGGMRAGCQPFNNAAFGSVMSDDRIRVVVLAARWDALVGGRVLLSSTGERPTAESSKRTLIASLRAALEALVGQGRRVILIGHTPLLAFDYVPCVNRARFNGLSELGCDPQATDIAEIAEMDRRVADALEEAARSLPGVQIVRPFAALCSSQHCLTSVNGAPAYMDKDHLSPAGARVAVGANLRDAIMDRSF
jgi:peptidoglycan/LPS O-acetylase OafA/YrhL